MADRAFLGGIGGIDVDYRHARDSGFVVDELPKLIEAPVMLFASLRLSNRASFLDTLEIFQDYQGRSVYSLRNQHLRDAVVCIPMEPCLFARKRLQMSLSTFCAASLKICLEVVDLFANLFDLITRELLPGRINGNIFDAKIYSKYVLRLDLFRLRNINHDTEIENAISEDKVCLTSNPIQSRRMIVTDQNRKLDSTIESQQRNPIEAFPREDSLIVDHRAFGIKLRLNRSVSLVGFNDLRYGSDGHLSRDTELIPGRIINNLLQLDFISAAALKSRLCYVITGSVKLMHSLQKRLELLRSSFKLDHQSLHHCMDSYDLCRNKGCDRRTHGLPLTTEVASVRPVFFVNAPGYDNQYLMLQINSKIYNL